MLSLSESDALAKSFYRIYNNTVLPSTLVENVESYFNNTNEKECSETAYSLFNEGCLTAYSGSSLSIRNNKVLQAKVNSLDKRVERFCIIAQTSHQRIKLDSLVYIQTPKPECKFDYNPNLPKNQPERS